MTGLRDRPAAGRNGTLACRGVNPCQAGAEAHSLQCLEEVSDVLDSTRDGGETLRRAVETALRLVDEEAGAVL